MEKDKKIFYSGLFLLIVAIISGYAVTGTYAKYTSGLEGSDTARTAIWSWKINNTALTASQTSFAMTDLFAAGKIYELSSDKCTTTVDAEVKQNGDAIVAPGTCGKVTISIENLSEVNAKYQYVLTETNAANIPIKYSLTGNAGTWNTISDLNTANASLGAKNLAMGASDSITLYWKWDYSTNSTQDQSDSAAGFRGTDTIALKATLQLTQVD